MKTPIYVEVEHSELDERFAKIRSLMREIDKETAFLSTKGPMLCVVPAPDHDCISIGGITVYGVSDLSESEKDKLVALLTEIKINR